MSVVAHNGSEQNVLGNGPLALVGHLGQVLSAKFDHSGEIIASSGMDRQILLWHWQATHESANFGVLEGHKGAVTSLDWVLSNKLFSTSADCTIAFWDAETGQKLRNGKGHELTVNDCTAGESVCLSVGDDGALRFWDEREKQSVKYISTEYPLLCCDLSSDGRIAYAAGIDPSIRAYEVASGKLLWKCDGFREPVTGLLLSSDGTMLVAKAMDGSVAVVNAKSSILTGMSRMGMTYDGAIGGQQIISRARFSKDDVFICLGSQDNSAILWSTASRRMTQRFTEHTGAVVDVDFHPQAAVLATCGADTVIVQEF